MMVHEPVQGKTHKERTKETLGEEIQKRDSSYDRGHNTVSGKMSIRKVNRKLLQLIEIQNKAVGL